MTFKMRGLVAARWVLAWAVLGATLAPQAVHAQVSEESAERLMRLSGQWAQLEWLAKQMRRSLVQGLASAESPPPAALQQRVAAVVDTAIRPQKLREVARRTVASGLRAPYLPELLRWYETPTAQKIAQAEIDDSAADRPDMKERVSAGMAVVQAATPARQALLARIVEATRAPQVATDAVISLGVAVPLALARLVPVPQLPSEAQLRAAMNEQRAQLLQAFEVITLASAALAYRDIADEALAAYGNFLASAAGQHHSHIDEQSYEAAVLDGIASIQP